MAAICSRGRGRGNGGGSGREGSKGRHRRRRREGGERGHGGAAAPGALDGGPASSSTGRVGRRSYVGAKNKKLIS